MSDRTRTEEGQYAETVTLERVLAVFEEIEGPAITSSDVAAALDCSTEAARQKLQQLYEQGRIRRRKTGRTVLWWRVENPTTAEPLREFVGMLDEDEADRFQERTQAVRAQFDREILGDDAPEREAESE